MARRVLHVTALVAGLAWVGARPALADQPIAGGWLLLDSLPGVQGPPCVARNAGREVNMNLMLNNVGEPVLLLARPDWHDLKGEADVTASLDGAAPETLRARMVINLVTFRIVDARQAQRLAHAQEIEWDLPFGHFRSRVSGLDRAMEAVAHCLRDRGGAPPTPAS